MTYSVYVYVSVSLCFCVCVLGTHAQPCCLLDLDARSQCIRGAEKKETLMFERAPESTTFNIRYPSSFKITLELSLFLLTFEQCHD